VSRSSEKPVYRRLIDRGRINLPADVVKDWGLSDGDYVQMLLSRAGGELIIRPVRA